MISIAPQRLDIDNLLERREAALISRNASLILIWALSVGIAVSPVRAQEGLRSEQGRAAILSYGGRLYDNHWRVLNHLPPPEPNPAYPADSRNTLNTTWRCVSCHGWDYSGSDGHLGQIGSKFISIRGAEGRDPAQVAQYLRSGSHMAIVAVVPDEALRALSLFICCGQHDIRTLIGRSGEAKGDPMRGKDIYDGVCNRCHQSDGKAPIYGELGDVSSLGWIARQRPAEVVHKIRNGVPSADMVSLRFLDIERIGDLLAYLQTLDVH